MKKKLVIKLEKDNQINYIFNWKFDLNGHAIGLTLDDKYSFSETLKSLNIPRCIHTIFYNHDNLKEHAVGCHTYKDVFNYFEKCHNDIVIKPNNGREGKDVYHVTNKEEKIKNRWNRI